MEGLESGKRVGTKVIRSSPVGVRSVTVPFTGFE